MRNICGVLAMALLFGLATAGRAADTTDANATLDKAIKALGGEEALGKTKAVSWKSKGTISFQNNESEISSTFILQDLNHFRQEFEGQFGGNTVKGVTVVNGDTGAREFGGNRQEMDKAALAAQKRTTYLLMVPITVLPLKSKDFKTEAIPDETVDGKTLAGLKVTGPDMKEFKLYFDKETGLPVRTVAKVAGFNGDEFTQETTYSDYKEMAGIKKATKLVSKRNGEKFMEQTISDFKILDKVDPKTFTETQ